MAKEGTTKYKSNKQEKRVAKDLEGKEVIGSGCLWGAKGDVKTDHFLIECKTTKNSYYSLKLKTWEKIRKEALKESNKIPIIVIDLKDFGNSYQTNTLVVLNKEDFEESHFKQFEEFVRVHNYEKESFRIINTELIFLFDFLKRDYSLMVLPWDDFINLTKSLY